MRSVWSVPMALALAITTAGVVQAQQPYPSQFSNQWMNSCVSSCQSNALYKDRQAVCAPYCTCIVQEVQASVPLEVAMQAEKDLANKNNNSEAVQRVNQVTHQCQARFAPQQAPTRQSKTR